MKRHLTKVIVVTLLHSLVLAVLLSAGCKRIDPKPEDGGLPVVKAEEGVEMILIPGGSFEMGSVREYEPDETPHEVYVDPFYLDKYEVTQEEYERVVGSNPSRRKGRDNPVDQIRWTDAATYSNARSRLEGLQPAYDPKTWRCDFGANGYRLPTESEWERAARAGTKTTYSFGNDPSQLGLHAWFKRNSTRGPHAVAEKEPNPWGLCDMYGNVWEWCNDFYHEDYYRQSPARNPRGPMAGENRVVRGGCWNSKPDMCRSSYRNYEDPGYTDACFGKDIHGFVGFRCARNDHVGSNN